MKTIKEWLSELPDGYRERALKYAKQSKLDIETGRMGFALSKAFPWKYTNESFDFWCSVYSHYMLDNFPLPPLPD
jgi:hypothetical protein